MDKLKEILDDFYCIFNIPIHFVDNNMNITYKIGYCEDTDKIINATSIYQDIRPNMLSVVDMTYFNNIHFITIPIVNQLPLYGYLIVGPFKSKYICNELNLPFKPLYCINYLSYILNDMFIKKFGKIKSYSHYINECLEYINKYYNIDLKIDDVCNHLSINKSYFCSLFKKETGYTFTAYLNNIRVEKSKELLVNSDLSILDVALKVGFNNHNYFSTTFKKIVGKNPLEYRKLSSLIA